MRQFGWDFIWCSDSGEGIPLQLFVVSGTEDQGNVSWRRPVVHAVQMICSVTVQVAPKDKYLYQTCTIDNACQLYHTATAVQDGSKN